MDVFELSRRPPTSKHRRHLAVKASHWQLCLGSC